MQPLVPIIDFPFFISVTSCPWSDQLDSEGKSCAVCHNLLPRVVILKMCKEIITVENRGAKSCGWGFSLTKISFQLPAKCFRTTMLLKKTYLAANCDQQSSARGLHFLSFAQLLTMKAPLCSHPNWHGVPKLTLENSQGMSPPIHQHAVLDSTHSYT